LAFDKEGRPWITFISENANLPKTADAYQPSIPPGEVNPTEHYVQQFSADGTTLLYSTLYATTTNNFPVTTNLEIDTLTNDVYLYRNIETNGDEEFRIQDLVTDCAHQSWLNNEPVRDGIWHLAKLCSPSMIANGGGSIINVASMLGHVGSTPVKQAHYCASKGAVVNLTRELALQWARKGVRVNSLCPGWFPSEMTAGMDTDEGSQQFIRTMSPIPRMGEAHELDGALLLLASRASTFMTGQSLIVDGGWTAR
jgi:NAD(P)-dependent dehydrogenase (short-subunit alcohol dehydrogenase family)